MKNYEPRLYDVKISQLHKLDTFANDSQKLDAALGSKLDAQGPEDRLINAARALFGKEVDDTVDLMISEGQPGFIYKQARLRMIASMYKTSTTTRNIPRLDDADATTKGTEAPSQQPL